MSTPYAPELQSLLLFLSLGFVLYSDTVLLQINMMFGYLLLLIFISLGGAFESLDSQGCQSECPTWFVPVNSNDTINCNCGNSSSEIVLCDENSHTSMLRFQYCMTYNEVNNSTMVGICPYHYHKPDVQGLYVKLPQNVCDLNEFMCGGLNRTGLLCSQCKAGLGPAVFSYTLSCLKCLDRGYGWLLYMFLATFPTTVMFLVVIICQARITTAPMNAFIFVCQVLSCMGNANPHEYTDTSKPSYYVTLFCLTIYGVFNLDLLRYILPQFCISSTMTTIQALSLEYIVAIYPLLLTIVLYVCIQLHARDFQPLVCLWRPFYKCCACISQRWSPSQSLVHTFAAFLLLSYSKILSVSFSLLHNGEYAQDDTGKKTGSLILYYNATVPYFSAEHLPFALLAISVLATFILLPVLILLLYPTRVFQRCIGCCSTRWHALDAFVDAFQGHYKDGTNGTPDWRYFSGLYLIFRILAIATDALPDMEYRLVYRVTCYSSASLFFGILQPYKENWINYWDAVTFMLLSLGQFVALYDEYVTRSRFSLAYGLGILPLVYIIVYTSYKLLSHLAVRHCALRCKNRNDEGRSAYNVGDVEREAYTNSEQREPLLTAASVLGGRYNRDEESTLWNNL